MNKVFFTLILFLTGCLVLQAVEPQDTTNIYKADSLAAEMLKADSLAAEMLQPDTIISNFDMNLDSMLQLYYIQESLTQLDTTSIRTDSVPVFSDSVYIARLAAIPTLVDLTYNPIVKSYINAYTKKKRNSVEVMLGLSEHYFPIFDEIFDYYDVPSEMKYMSIIESALNPRAYSRARAVGLWQFMYGTGRKYGLEINSLVDERRDPIRSTHAAARFSRDLYNIYGDWILVIAAYNCGPGNVNRAIRRSGGKTNYWEIYRYLPRETRGHVPAFIAATYVMNYYKEHNLFPKAGDIPIVTDTIHVKEQLHLKQVAEVLDIPLKAIRDLNPQYRHDIIPAGKKTYSLCLPVEYTLSFIDHEDSIYTFKDSLFFDPSKQVISPPSNYQSYKPGAPGPDYVKLNYTVKYGDNIGYISEWYGIKASNLRYWNDIRRNMIRTGEKLVIYKHKSVAKKYEDINSLSFAEKQARIGKTATTSSASVSTPSDYKGEYILYTVQSGDTLWEIAKKYEGVNETDIMRLNNLNDGNRIKPGQVLRIKPKS